MIAAPQLEEYLEEIRKQVCSRCIERPPGGPPCAPLGKDCGVELHLPQLLDAIHEVRDPLIGPYLDNNRRQICEHCQFLHSNICPCPMDYLAVLLVQAVETVDARQHGNDTADRTNYEPADIEDLRAALRAALGAWTGCDWPTCMGKTKLNLVGRTSTHASAMIEKALDPIEAEDWRLAAGWLAKVEEHARRAANEAEKSLRAAEAGHWREALNHAERAWALEFATGRPIWHAGNCIWRKFHELMRTAYYAQMPPSSDR